MRSIPFLVAAGLVVAAANSPSWAQEAPAAQPRAASIRAVGGVVIDSMLTDQPLAGATVVLMGSGATAMTDRAGRFFFDSASTDTLRLTVFHPRLDSLGYGSPVWRVPPGDVDETALQLSTPSAGAVHRARCDNPPDATGLLAGQVYDALSAGPISGVTLELRWSETDIARGMRAVQRRRSVISDAEGRFEMCGIPNDIMLDGSISTAGGIVRTIALDFRGRPLMLQFFSIARNDAVLGDFRGKVVRETGDSIPGARISYGSPERQVVADDRGVFRIPGVPVGSLAISLRAIGHQVTSTTVTVFPGDSAEVTPVVLAREVVLSPRVIERERRPSILETSGFNERRAAGFGSFITSEQIAGRGGVRFAEVFYGVPGIRIVQVDGRDVLTATRSGNACVPNYWVDGTPQHSSRNTGPDQFVLAQDVEGIEVYQGASNIPAQFRGFIAGCPAVVVIWTKRQAGARAPR